MYFEKNAVLPLRVIFSYNSSVNKSIWWMPWRMKAMKDVIGCDKLRLAAIKH